MFSGLRFLASIQSLIVITIKHPPAAITIITAMKISINAPPWQEELSLICNDYGILFILMQDFTPHLSLWTYGSYKLAMLK